MSHHLDSPTAKEDGRVDITDIYIFASENPGFTVLVMAVNPLAGELSPTTFRAGAIYDFKVDIAVLDQVKYTFRTESLLDKD